MNSRSPSGSVPWTPAFTYLLPSAGAGPALARLLLVITTLLALAGAALAQNTFSSSIAPDAATYGVQQNHKITVKNIDCGNKGIGSIRVSVPGNVSVGSASLQPGFSSWTVNVTSNPNTIEVKAPNGGGLSNGDYVEVTFAATPTSLSTATFTTSAFGNNNFGGGTRTLSGSQPSVTIERKELTGSFTAASKVYDATTSATVVTRTLNGVVSSDEVNLIGGTAAFSDKNAGNGKTVTLSGATLAGSKAGNYALAAGPITTTADITQKPASVTPNAANKTYGAADPTFSGMLSGFIAGDGITANYNRTPGESVLGSPYAISATLSPSGVLSNYNITYNTAQFTINKADATITVSGYTGVYDGQEHGATGTATGANGEDLSSLLSLGAKFVDVPGGTANWTFPGDGNHNSTGGSVTITIEKANQTISFAQPTTPAKFGSAPIGLNASATSGLPVSFVVTFGDANWLVGGSIQIPASGDSNVDFKVKAIQAGNDNYNPAPDFERTVQILENSPATTTATQAPAANGAGWNNGSVTVTLASQDNPGGSGIASIKYRVDGGAWQSVSASTVQVPVSGEGDHTVEFQAIDLADNLEATKSHTLKIDSVKPTGSTSAPAADNTYQGRNWYRSQKTITFNGSDDRSGISGVALVQQQTVAAGQSGYATLSHAFLDNAGNQSDAIVFEYYFDDEAPTITITGIAGGNSVNNIPALGVDVADPFLRSDLTNIVLLRKPTVDAGFDPANLYSPGMAITQSGIYQLKVDAYDEAGNHATTTISFTVLATAPDVQILTPAAGWHTSNSQTITYSAFDAVMQALSPVLQQLLGGVISPFNIYNNFVNTDQGRFEVKVSATDAANQTSVASREFMVDRGAPEVHQDTGVVGTPGTNSWWKGPSATVTVKGSDPELRQGVAGSGIHRIEYSLNGGNIHTNVGDTLTGVISTPGVHNLSYTIFDVAGNSTPDTMQIKFDNVAPAIVGLPSIDVQTADQVGGKVVNWPAITGSDTHSGVASVQVNGVPAGNLFPVGTTAVTVKVTDNAGNETTAKFDVVVKRPAPVLDNITPAKVTYGGGSVEITLNGSGFFPGVDGSTVSFDGSVVNSTWVSWNQMKIEVQSGNAGIKKVKVGTSASSVGGDGGTSNELDFTVEKANATITVTGYSVTYDGNAHTASGTATGVNGEDLSSLIDLSNTTHTNAGDYTDAWSFSGNDNYNSVEGTANDKIAKADATINVNGYNGVYDGNPHGATGSAIGAKGETLSGLNLGASFTNVPGGTANWTFTDSTGNYKNANGSVQITITKVDATIEVSGYTGVYDGDPHGATGSAKGVKGETLSGLNLGSSFTNVPGGTANWTFTDITGNYNNANGSVEIAIAKANAEINVQGYTGIYDGQSHGANGSAMGVKGETLSGLDLGASFTNVPGGTANWVFTDTTGNYNNASGTASIVINRADATINVSGYTGTYDGNAHGATGTATGVGGVNLSSGLNLGASFTNVPGGTASWTFTDSTGNYNDASGSVEIVINKANATIAVHGYAGNYDGHAHGATGSATGVNGEDLSSLLDLGESFTNAPGGTANWAFAGDENYNAASGSVQVTISKRPVQIIADSKTKVFGAEDPALTYTVGEGLINGDTVTGSLTRVAGEAVGSYAIQLGTLTAGDNYQLQLNQATLTIGAWTAQGFFAPISASIIKAPNESAPMPAANTVWQTSKGGSNIPLKFRVFADNVEKTSLSDVVSFAYTLIANSGGADDWVDGSTTTAGATNLKYEDGQFHLNWKTTSVTKDTCYRVSITLRDGTTIHTFVKLKK